MTSEIRVEYKRISDSNAISIFKTFNDIVEAIRYSEEVLRDEYRIAKTQIVKK